MENIILPSRFMKRLYKPGEFLRILSDLILNQNLSSLQSKKGKINKKFQERLMLAVTEVNGCRYCSYFHTQVSLRAGLERSEIEKILSGDFNNTPDEELAALFFAQHYADSGGKPNPESIECLSKTYGETLSRSILVYIRAIMVGNAWGNMLDALRNRFKGNPVADSTLLDELGVLFGPLYMIPFIFIKKLVQISNFL